MLKALNYVSFAIHPLISLIIFIFAESYNVNSDLVSVSGFSSGAFFAVQFHVAFSKDVVGVGAVGGGMYSN